MLGVQFDNEVASFEADPQGDKLEGIAQVLTKCANPTVVDGKDRTPMTGTGLSFPNLGDQTLAFRAKAKSEGIEKVVDIVSSSRSGTTSCPSLPRACNRWRARRWMKIARTGMAKVAAAAKS